MGNGWRLNLIRPNKSVEVAVTRGWAEALQDLDKWMSTELIDAMVYGGIGIQGINDTPFYRFISSPDGLSELGIEASEPPRLLEAYKASFKISRNNHMIVITFGDAARLKMGTPHPAAGTGFLQITSWMEWILDGKTVGSGYVPRAKLPSGAQKSIRVQSSPGGLMLPRGALGSTGLWRFPTNIYDYDRAWLASNVGKINDAVVNQLAVFLTRRLK